MKKMLSLPNGLLLLYCLILFIFLGNLLFGTSSRLEYAKHRYKPLIKDLDIAKNKDDIAWPKDSTIARIKWQADINLNANGGAGSSTGNIFLSDVRDTSLGEKGRFNVIPGQKKYYIGLAGYYIAEGRYFFVENKTGYFTGKDYENRRSVNYRYIHDAKGIFIPVSQGLYDFLEIIRAALMIVLAIVSLFVFVRMPFDILINIAKGRPFTEQNIRDLYAIGRLLMVIYLLPVLLVFLLHLLFLGRITNDVVFNWQGIIGNNIKVFLCAVVVLAFATAFKKGAKLQQEADLTV
jgi:hypothetical protein